MRSWVAIDGRRSLLDLFAGLSRFGPASGGKRSEVRLIRSEQWPDNRDDRGGAGNARDAVMLGHPLAGETQLFGSLGEADGPLKRLTRGSAQL